VSDWFFTSDLHGQGALYEQVVALVGASAGRAPAGRGPGPSCRRPGWRRAPEGLPAGFFVEFARRLREAAPSIDVLVLMGNDDWGVNMDVLEAHDGRCGASSTTAS